MRDEDTAAVMHDKAEKIMQKIQQGRLYGEPIDLLNPEEILLAAYWVGYLENKSDLSAVYDITAKML